MVITIVQDRLPFTLRRHRYMVDGFWIDYLGQILIQKGYTIPKQARFPSDLKTVIPGFTHNCRGVIVNSSLTMSILELDRYNLHERKDQFTRIMTQHHYKVLWK